MKNLFAKSRGGFTLIELLVVIAIIGLLASVVFASLNSARAKARDARRIVDLKQIQNAINLYFDQNGQYPPNCNSGWCQSTAGGNWISGLSNYLSTVPVDPVNNAGNNQTTGNFSYAYYSYPNAPDYDLVAQLEDHANPNRCEVKCWRWHVANGPDTTSMCAGAGSCTGVVHGSPYLYADH